MEDLIYITAMLGPQYVQMTLDDFLFGEFKQPSERNCGVATTKTVRSVRVPPRLLMTVDVEKLTGILSLFNEKYRPLREAKRHDLYRTFYIPKKSGGMRKIDAPNNELMSALRELKLILETEFHALYHTSAYAYVKQRSTLHAMQKHQKNESKWFAKPVADTYARVVGFYTPTSSYQKIRKTEFDKRRWMNVLSNDGIMQ